MAESGEAGDERSDRFSRGLWRWCRLLLINVKDNKENSMSVMQVSLGPRGRVFLE